MAEIFDELFDDEDMFVEYMRENDSAELRKRLLVTDQLRLIYCRFVCCRESVFNSIDSDWVDYFTGMSWVRDGLSWSRLRTICGWLDSSKKAKDRDASRGSICHTPDLSSHMVPVMLLEDEAKEMGAKDDG